MSEFHKLYRVGETSALKDLVKNAIDFARVYFLDHGEFPYVWYVQTPLGQFPVIAPDMPPGGKDDCALAIRTMLEEVDAESYVFMAEAWIAAVSLEELREGVTASQHPQRVEVLTVLGEDGEQTISGHFKIIRKAGKRPTLSKFEYNESDSLSGRFTGMLPDKGKHTHH